MAAKRLGYREGDDHDDDEQPKEKRSRSIPSFASVVEMVISRNTISNISNVVEPWFRKVVAEEVESALQRNIPTLRRSPSLRIQAPEPASLKLMFINKFMPSMLFTCNKIFDINDQPLKLALVEQRGDQVTPTYPAFPIKIEIVAIDGNFPSTDREVWTDVEFNDSVVKERTGKRPLLTKDLNYTIKDKNCVTLGDIEFTDNSSWIPCRKFKLGARVVVETSRGVRILEALTDAFVVKDHRGELYKKHYPPQLGDEVWRLEKIGKDGIIHKRLIEGGINNVQDLLKLSVLDPPRLRKILGGKNGTISEKTWEAILKHARTCNLGNKLYICTGPNCSILLNPICQISSIKIQEHETYSTSNLNPTVKHEVNQLVENAYRNWDSLLEVERPVNDQTPQPFQGNLVGQYGHGEESMMPSELVIGGIIEVGATQFTNTNYLHMPLGGWLN